MPIKRVQFPDGSIKRVEVPDGATDEQILSFVQSSYQQPADFSGVQGGSSTKTPQRSLMQQVGHELSYGTRDVLEGVGSSVDFIGEPLAAGLEAITGTRQLRFRDIGRNVADFVGLDRPESASERVASDVNRGLSGLIGAGGVGRAISTDAGPALTGIRNMLTSQPALQTASTVTGAGSAGVARESGATPGQQMAAGVIGGLAPGMTATAGSAAVRGAVRGGDGGRRAMEESIADFRRAGTTPTVSQATGNRRTQGLESLLARVPGGAGVMARKGEQQQSEIGARLRDMADDLARGADPSSAGSAIRDGIKGRGADSFVSRTSARSNRLYDALDSQMPMGRRVDVQNTDRVLESLNPEIVGAPAMSPFFQNARIGGIKAGFKQDTQGLDSLMTRPGIRDWVESQRGALLAEADDIARGNVLRTSTGLPPRPVPSAAEIDEAITARLGGMVDGRLPYEAVKKTRTLVGREIADNRFNQDVPKGDWNAMYGGLSDDMRNAAQTEGQAAAKAFERANKHFSAVGKRSDAIDHVVNRDTPEGIFQAALQGTDTGATTLRAVLKSLPDSGRKQVAAAVLNRMGRAINSQQNAGTDAFSTQTFLTNWAKLSPEARSALFDRFGPEFRKSVQSLTSVAANLRQGAKVYANPSGTSAAMTQIGTAGGIGGALLAGSPATAAAILGGVGGANVLARAAANQNVVNWLARPTVAPTGSAVPLMLLPRDRNNDKGSRGK